MTNGPRNGSSQMDKAICAYDFDDDSNWEVFERDEHYKDFIKKTVCYQYEKIMNKLSETHQEVQTLHPKADEIIRLQRELDRKNNEIKELLESRKMAKDIYWIGIFSGIVSGILGLISDNFYYLLISGSILITSSFGLWEAKKNAW